MTRGAGSRDVRARMLAAAVAAALCVGPALTLAQQPRSVPAAAGRAAQAPAAPRGGQAPAAPAEPAGGLDTLGDDALFSELAGRGQESLLDRAFELNKIPEARRAGLRAFGALRELTNKQKPPTPSRRQALIAQVVKGARTVVPTIKDPAKLTETASLLLTEGAMRDVNLLEYWGENPATQARLRPVMETVAAMYNRAAVEAEAAKADVEKRMANPNDKASADRWMKLEEAANTALFTRHMADYYLALSVPRAGDGQAQRAKIADAAIEYLKELDTEDSEVQPAVRNRIGKLQMAKADYAAAKETLQSVIDNKAIKPPADAYQQYEARYFSAVCDLEAGNTDAARKALGDLLKWQQQNLPNKEDVQKGVAAAAEMMQYRVFLAESAKAKAAGDAAAADKAQAAAIDVLTKLSNDRPDLRPIISEQLVDRVDIRRGVGTLDPLLLRALVQKGIAERDKAEGEPADARVLGRAVEAAEELVRRKGAKGVDETVVESAALLVPTFLEKMGRKAEAANRYLDFLKAYPRSAQAEAAFNSAGTLIVMDLRRGPDKGTKEVVDAWTRFLPVAIEKPFNRVGLAFDYAERLRAEKKFKDAAAYYARVPDNDPRHVASRYLQMVSLYALLQQTAAEPGVGAPAGRPQYAVQGEARKQLAADVLRLAEQARKLAADALPGAKDDAERARHQLKVAGATLTEAEIASGEQNDPRKTLAALATFEKDVQGLPGAQDMLNRALYLRVMALIAGGQLDQATKALADLQERSGGRQGQEILFDLLTRLDSDLEKAQAAGDDASMRKLAQNRAALSGFLVERARSSKNADLNKRVYSYSVYDAESKRLAGGLGDDPKQLRDALEAFRRLQTPEMTALYRKEAADNPKNDASAPHPNVVLGIGLTSFDLGDFKTAQETLGRLLVEKRLGGPELQKVDEKTNETYYVDNGPYWEATFKLLRSNVELYKQKKDDPAARDAFENTKSHLKRLYVRGGVGGKKWGPAFEALRAEIIPEFDPKADAPATQPGGTDEEGQKVVEDTGRPPTQQAAGPAPAGGETAK